MLIRTLPLHLGCWCDLTDLVKPPPDLMAWTVWQENDFATRIERSTPLQMDCDNRMWEVGGLEVGQRLMLDVRHRHGLNNWLHQVLYGWVQAKDKLGLTIGLTQDFRTAIHMADAAADSQIVVPVERPETSGPSAHDRSAN